MLIPSSKSSPLAHSKRASLCVAETLSQKVRLIDVARKAGVASGTVSRVLHAHRDVGAELVRRVMEAVRSTGYVHQARTRAVAGACKTDRSGGDVGAIFFGGGADALGRSDALGMLQGLERELSLKARSLVVGRSLRESLVPHFLMRRRVDGLLLINLDFETGEPDWLREAYNKIRTFPHVWMKTRPTMTGGDLCSPDMRRAGFLAADYLAKRGHRRVGFFCTGMELSDPLSLQAAFSARAQVTGLESSLLDLFFEESAGRPASEATRLFEFFLEVDAQLRPTALFVPSYDVASHFSALLEHAGIRVGLLTCAPEQPTAIADGRITMIDMRFDSLSRRAVEQLLLRMGNPIDNADWMNLSVEPVLVERGSVARLI